MVVEHLENPRAVYQRFHEYGRMLPAGLIYRDSWLTGDRRRCFQVMETDDPALLDAWMGRWSDLVRFEVHPVMSSIEAARVD
jgi:hypothetical protein